MALSLTESERALWTTRLAEAEEALHAASIGSKELSVAESSGQSSTSVSFQGVSPDKIRSYVDDCRRRLGMSAYHQHRPLVIRN